MEETRIAESAFKHGITRSQILATLRLPYRLVRIEEDRVLIIGADNSGRLIELVALDPQGCPVVIHAMLLREKFWRYL